MRLRKQSKPTAQPGDAFLRAVSTGRERQPPAAVPRQPPADLSGMRERLQESERRAVAADEALRQIREEGDERLEQAREALARERSARVAAERRVAELTYLQEAPEVPVPPEEPERPEPEPLEPESLDPEPVDPEYARWELDDPDPGPEFADGDDLHPEEHAPEDGQEEGWPAPWLEEEKRPRRGLFRRSRS